LHVDVSQELRLLPGFVGLRATPQYGNDIQPIVDLETEVAPWLGSHPAVERCLPLSENKLHLRPTCQMDS